MSQDIAFRTHWVIKRNQRLYIQCVETGAIVYTPPDFLRPKIRNRDMMLALARRLDREWFNPIQAIVEFETNTRPDS